MKTTALMGSCKMSQGEGGTWCSLVFHKGSAFATTTSIWMFDSLKRFLWYQKSPPELYRSDRSMMKFLAFYKKSSKTEFSNFQNVCKLFKNYRTSTINGQRVCCPNIRPLPGVRLKKVKCPKGIPWFSMRNTKIALFSHENI